MSGAASGASIAAEELRAAARVAAESAYAPYSRFQVGAAIRWADGSVTTGANVENVSYSLCLCAERSAVAVGTSNGAREIREVAVWADVDDVADEVVTPCGACRQVLCEFAECPDLVTVHLGGRDSWETMSLAELLPRAFGGA